jgi:hypothetical protein
VPVIYVARSASLAQWASDVGLSKHVYKIGVTDDPVKPLVAAGWAGLTDWVLVKKQDDVPPLDEAGMFAHLSVKERVIDPALYPRIKGTIGLFKILPSHVENHLLISRALAGMEQSGELRLKPADFAQYLIQSALKTTRPASHEHLEEPEQTA